MNHEHFINYFLVFGIYLLIISPGLLFKLLAGMFLKKSWNGWKKDLSLTMTVPLTYSILLVSSIGLGKTMSNVKLEIFYIACISLALFIQKSIYNLSISVGTKRSYIAPYIVLNIFVIVIVDIMPIIPA